MSSGGQFGMAKKGFTGLVGKAAKLGSKVTGIGKPKNDSFNPFNLLSSKDVNKLVKSIPSQKQVTPTTTSKASTKPTIIQIILLLFFSFLLGTLMFYLNNKDSGTSSIKNIIMVVCIMIAAIGITGFLNLNINIYDLLISSQINILCLFLFLSYIGVTTLGSWDMLLDIGAYAKDILGIFINPTKLFSKGFDLIIPTLFMTIPFIILITNFLKMSGVNFIGAVVGAILTAIISIVVVYFLWPDNLTSSPIQKSMPTSTETSTFKKFINFLF